MNKVLLTGINGFTGKYVHDLLVEQGYTVIGLVQDNPTNNDCVCDITDKKSVILCLDEIKPNYIIHLAALSFVGHCDKKAFYDVNVFGTTNILEAVYELNLNVRKIILASSANVYGNPINVTRIHENISPSPVNHYAMSKLAMEYMAKTWFDKLPIIISRPFNYTGVGQSNSFLIPKIVSHFKQRRKTIELGNIDVSRDFSDVRDIANAYLSLLKSDVKSEIFNLCSGNVYSLNSIINICEQLVGYEINVNVNPDFVRMNEIKTLCGDNSKLYDDINFKSVYSIEQTIKDMINEN